VAHDIDVAGPGSMTDQMAGTTSHSDAAHQPPENPNRDQCQQSRIKCSLPPPVRRVQTRLAFQQSAAAGRAGLSAAKVIVPRSSALCRWTVQRIDRLRPCLRRGRQWLQNRVRAIV
jgi:hypothetical protein